MKGYTLFNQKHGRPLTLYHGLNGSRKLEVGKWIHAAERIVHNPGKKTGTPFRSGFHFFASREDAITYKSRFAPNKRRLLLLAAVEVRGARPKPNSPAWLASEVRLGKGEWEKAERIAV